MIKVLKRFLLKLKKRREFNKKLKELKSREGFNYKNF